MAGTDTHDDPFDLLEQLVAQLPDRQADSDRLSRARAAERVLAAAHEHGVHAAALYATDRSLEGAREAERAALASGDAEALDHARRDVLFWGQQRGLRVGPEQNARAELDEALAAGGFASEEDAAKAALPAEERARLEQAIADYRHRYAQTLARCEALEAAGERGAR
jgi:hypothetical protein